MTRRIGAMFLAAIWLSACSSSSDSSDGNDSAASVEVAVSDVDANGDADPDNQVGDDDADNSGATGSGSAGGSASPGGSGSSSAEGNGVGWTISTNNVSGDDQLWTGERCDNDEIAGTWVLTSERVTPSLGTQYGTLTIEVDAAGSGTYEIYVYGDSQTGNLAEVRGGGTVTWRLLDDGNVEFQLVNTEINTTYFNGAEVDTGNQVVVTYAPMVWVAGTC